MKRSVALASTAVLLVSGCADMSPSQTSTAQGAGIGAGAGALLGLFTAGGNPGGSAATGAVTGAALGALGGYLWNDHLEKQKMRMQKAADGTDIKVTQTTDNRLKINVPTDAGFALGSARLNAKMHPILDELALSLLQNPTESIQVIGYTDDTGADSINIPLSQNRAQSVAGYLLAHGVQPQRITTQAMGAQNPVASNETAEGRASNRRVEIYIAYPPKSS